MTCRLTTCVYSRPEYAHMACPVHPPLPEGSPFVSPAPGMPPVIGQVKALLTFAEFSAANRTRCEHAQGFHHALASWSTSDWFLAVLGELGEAANVAKKLNRVRDGIPGNKESADVLRQKLRKELGDAFVYLDLLAQSLGVHIADAAIEVFNEKSVEIGYPVLLVAAPLSPARLVMISRIQALYQDFNFAAAAGGHEWTAATSQYGKFIGAFGNELIAMLSGLAASRVDRSEL